MVLLGLCLPVDAKKWDGVNIKIVMSDWAKLAIEKFALRFYDKTGLNVTLVADNSVSLVPMMKSESERGFGHDGYMVLANTMKEAAHYGYLVDMTDRVRADDNLAWDDYLKFYRDYNSAYNKRTWGMPADGGLLGVFSRADLFPRGQEPQTIDELVEMVEFYDGKDINGDGIPDRGWCECIGPTDDILTVLVNGENTMQFIVTYMQSKGSEQGYFFDPVTMEPNVQAEGFRRGFSQAVRVWRSGTREPENHCNLFPNGETAITHPRWRWAAGSCVVVNWLGGVMQDRYFNNTWIGSRKEKVHMFPFPGSTSVDVDGKLTECASDPSVCPYATKGRNGEKINVTPYAALNGGYTMVIGNHSQHIDATFDFMAFVNGPEQSKELVISETTDAFEPFRQTHMVHAEWEKLFGTWITDEFLATTKITNVGDKNIAPDIQLPDGAFYAVDVGIALGEAVSNGKTVDESLLMLRDMWWSRIEKHGFEQMRDLYRATIGLPPYSQVVTTVSQGSSLETWHYIVIAVGCVLVVVAIVVLLYKYQMSQRAYRLQFSDNIVAARCAKAIASMQLDQVAYLTELKTPNAIQASFIEIVDHLTQYKAYMPQSLFVRHSSTYEQDGVEQPTVAPPGLDIETATIVFTDIRASTSIWENTPEGMRAGLQIHNAVMRDVMRMCGGYEVKTIGDAFMIAFASTFDGVAFGLRVQERLFEADWPASLLEDAPICSRQGSLWGGLTVRIGVNTGPVTVEQNTLTGRTDYLGHTVNVASRLESTCTPGAVAVPSDLWTSVSESCSVVAGVPEAVHLKGVSGNTLVCCVWPVSLGGRRETPLCESSSPTAKRTMTMSTCASSVSSTNNLSVSTRQTSGTLGVAQLAVGDVGQNIAFHQMSSRLTTLTTALEQSGGSLVTLLGNCVCVGWNVSRSAPAHMENAIRFVQRMSVKSALNGAGLASGLVQHGDVGARSQRFVTVMGDVVHRSWALCIEAVRYGVVCLYEPPEGTTLPSALEDVLVQHKGCYRVLEARDNMEHNNAF